LPRPGRTTKPLETIWEINDSLWQRIEPILLEDAPLPPKSHGGRKRVAWRVAINGIDFRLRFGCQWNKLPKHFGDNSSVHRWFQRWGTAAAEISVRYSPDRNEVISGRPPKPTGPWTGVGAGIVRWCFYAP
jgi:hypothetical protein